MICIIGSETTENYGLLNDLRHLSEFMVVYAKRPCWDRTLAWRALRRFFPQFPELYEANRSWKRSIEKKLGCLDRIIVIDTALRHLELSFLEHCKAIKPDLQIDCWLLNSTESWTFSDPRIHSRIDSFGWNAVLTFDPKDAEQNAWVYTGLHNYSKLALPVSRNPRFDIFYAGSIKGQRGDTLLRLLARFHESGIKSHFICPSIPNLSYDPEKSEGLQLIRKRISYKKILKQMMDSNCILEVLQDGQTGATLRYCEAVCYNKKLLTTNANIVNFPFYDSRYMKVISADSEIDPEWIKNREQIDYGYRNEFSPVKLFCVPPSDESACIARVR